MVVSMQVFLKTFVLSGDLVLFEGGGLMEAELSSSQSCLNPELGFQEAGFAMEFRQTTLLI